MVEANNLTLGKHIRIKQGSHKSLHSYRHHLAPMFTISAGRETAKAIEVVHQTVAILKMGQSVTQQT